MSVQEARQVLNSQLSIRTDAVNYGPFYRDASGGTRDDVVALYVRAPLARFQVHLASTQGAPTGTVNFAYKDMTPRVQHHYWSGWTEVAITSAASINCWCESSAQSIVDALATLKAAGADEELSAARFDQALKDYRAAAVKPALPEDAIKYKVQAEGAIRDKSFMEAADLYGQALKAAPWWPEGHFNSALALSETGQYEDAVAEMKRFLALAPGSPDARAAQLNIYEWERKAK